MTDKRPIWFASFVLVVFCLGGLIGYRIGTHMPAGRGGAPGFFDGRGPGRGGPPFARGGPPPALPPDLLNRLSSELQLDASQQQQVKKILEDRRDRLDQVHREARERFDKETADLHAAIRGVLRADQQESFEKFLQRAPQRGRGRGGR